MTINGLIPGVLAFAFVVAARGEVATLPEGAARSGGSSATPAMTQQADFEEVGLRLGDLTPLRHELLSSRIAGQQVIGGGRVAALGTLS